MATTEKAPAKKAAAKRKDREVPDPLEAEDRGYRRVKHPTRARFERKPAAVVLLTWVPEEFGDGIDCIADRDFDHGSATKTHDVNGKQMTEIDILFTAHDAWAKADVAAKKTPEMRHATIEVKSTKPDDLRFGKMEFRGGPVKWRAAMRAALEANPELIFSKTKSEQIEERAAVKGKRAKKKAAAPKAAAPKKRAAVAQRPKGDAPKPRQRRRVKRAAAQKGGN